MKIAVYSCVTGNYDKIEQTLFSNLPKIDCDASFFLFSDDLNLKSDIWKVLPLKYQENCKRRTARWHKVNSHILFPNFDVTVWIDGTQAFNQINLFSDFIEPHLDKNISTFKHPFRNCIYQELMVCIELKKDSEDLMKSQIEKYKLEKYPPNNGLVETSCLIRKNTNEVSKFNNAWWKEIKNHSLRDQLSFNYVAYKTNTFYGIIPGHRESSVYFTFFEHQINHPAAIADGFPCR